MTESQKYLASINEKLNIIRYQLESGGTMGLTDLHKYCEGIFVDFLNTIFDLNLVNLNKQHITFPGIDLGDHAKGIAFQITTDGSSKKINDTLQKIIQHKLYTQFSKVNFLVLSSKQNRYTLKIDHEQYFEFDTRKNILDLNDIIRACSNLPVSKLKELCVILEKEIPGNSHFRLHVESTNAIRAIKAFEVANNIFVITSDGNKKQLTFHHSDSDPLIALQNEYIVFVRRQQKYDYFRQKIIVVDILTLEEKVIADQKPYFDGVDGSFDILSVRNLLISKDGNSLYFIVEKYTTASQVVKLNLNSGEWIDLFSAESFELFDVPDQKTQFLVSTSEIRDSGRNIYYNAYDETGNTIRNFENKDELMKYRSVLSGQNYIKQN